MRAESVRLNQQLGNLKTEKTALEKEIVRMTKRTEELEDAIGKDSDEEKWAISQFKVLCRRANNEIKITKDLICLRAATIKVVIFCMKIK